MCLKKEDFFLIENKLSEGALMVSNRLRKNSKQMKRWLKQEQIHCYRLYDADMPEYAVAVDVYEGENRWVHMQEYEAPKSVDPIKAQQRLDEAVKAVCDVLDINQKQLFLKVRRQQKGKSQYEKLAANKQFYKVVEAGHQFLVNFEDYLDTGLFLDHRITRRILGQMAENTSFLNLFAYTGSATVYAAVGGALKTMTVDMSNTYLDWAKCNMTLNHFDGAQHQFVQANCLEWLDAAVGMHQYDLIFLDPPSFSASKRMKQTFDVQRDHVALIQKTMKLLTPGGYLVFSNNLKRFKLDYEKLKNFNISDITKSTIPKDFERNQRIHQCFKIS